MAGHHEPPTRLEAARQKLANSKAVFMNAAVDFHTLPSSKNMEDLLIALIEVRRYERLVADEFETEEHRRALDRILL